MSSARLPPRSTSITLRRKRPRYSAAVSPAGPPPMIRQSTFNVPPVFIASPREPVGVNRQLAPRFIFAGSFPRRPWRCHAVHLPLCRSCAPEGGGRSPSRRRRRPGGGGRVSPPHRPRLLHAWSPHPGAQERADPPRPARFRAPGEGGSKWHALVVNQPISIPRSRLHGTRRGALPVGGTIPCAPPPNCGAC